MMSKLMYISTDPPNIHKSADINHQILWFHPLKNEFALFYKEHGWLIIPKPHWGIISNIENWPVLFVDDRHFLTPGEAKNTCVYMLRGQAKKLNSAYDRAMGIV